MRRRTWRKVVEKIEYRDKYGLAVPSSVKPSVSLGLGRGFGLDPDPCLGPDLSGFELALLEGRLQDPGQNVD